MRESISTYCNERLNLKNTIAVVVVYQFVPFIISGITTVLVVACLIAVNDTAFDTAFHSVDSVLIPVRALLGSVVGVCLAVWLAYSYIGYTPPLVHSSRWRSTKRQIVGVLGATLSGALLAAACLLAIQFGPEFIFGGNQRAVHILRHNNLAIGVLFFNGIILGPITEEFIFRGLMFDALIKRFRLLTVALMVSLFFVLLHAPRIYLYPATAFGLCGLALLTMYYRIRSRALLAPIALHTVYNAAALVGTALLYR